MLHDLIMPHMGESIVEATILRWLVKEGDKIVKDQPVLEIATDKVDSEISAPVSGVLTQILFHENSVAPIDSILAIISDGEGDEVIIETNNNNNFEDLSLSKEEEVALHEIPYLSEKTVVEKQEISFTPKVSKSEKFYSPLVKTIAKEENISIDELDQLAGTGADGRVSKTDLLAYIEAKKKGAVTHQAKTFYTTLKPESAPAPKSGAYDIVEMDRMRRLIADHMVMSKQTSPHVTSFIEVDMTNIVHWRNNIKSDFQKKHNQNLTFTPVIIDAAVRAIKEYPLINSSLNGYQILQKKNINIGMATALPSGNLIVPVIKNADSLSMQGLAFTVNDLALRARENKLKPDEITDGTFTITNLGAFSSLTGIPIINQPQLAILALGTIQKKPVVIESAQGDMIAIRQMMILSMSYDHRVIDGYLGGMFLKKIKDTLESFDTNTVI